MVIRRGLLCIALSTIALAGTPVAADSITTDRPDFVESSNTVGRGVFQIETSVAFDTFEAGSAELDTFSTPTLLRWGVADNWELRLETDGFIDADLQVGMLSSSDNGFADIALGTKWHTHDGGDGAPSIGWLFHLSLPTGSDAFTSDEESPSVRASLEWDLSDFLAAGVMPGLAHDATPGDGLTGILAAVLAQNWTDELNTFVEIAAEEIGGRFGEVVTFDTGVAWRPDEDWQLDFALVFGLNDESPDFGMTFGYSRRFN